MQTGQGFKNHVPVFILILERIIQNGTGTDLLPTKSNYINVITFTLISNVNIIMSLCPIITSRANLSRVNRDMIFLKSVPVCPDSRRWLCLNVKTGTCFITCVFFMSIAIYIK